MSDFLDSCGPSTLRRRRTSAIDPIFISHENYSMAKQTVSVLYSALPVSIRSLLPPILSVVATSASSNYADKPWTSSTSSGSSTPSTEADSLVGGDYGVVSTLDIGTVRHASPDSGVDWKSGRPGLELLICAVEEAKGGAAMRSGQLSSHSARFERRAYIDGVSYLLRGLPQNLDEAEVFELRSALPPSVAEAQISSRGQLVYAGQSRHGYKKPSVLHKSLRAIVARTMMLCFILWPYILTLLRWAAAYEKKHRISEQVIAQGITLVTTCGNWTLAAVDAICSRGDGRIGQVLADTVAWTVHDTVTGISEGVQEGLSRVERVSAS